MISDNKITDFFVLQIIFALFLTTSCNKSLLKQPIGGIHFYTSRLNTSHRFNVISLKQNSYLWGMIQPDFNIIAMRAALDEAHKALDLNEIPIGAVITCNNIIIARAHNLTETLNDPTAHAEMQAITSATNALGAKYLQKCSIYVTLEPCPMCAAALRWAQIDQIYWGASDEKFGYTTISHSLIHPKTKIFKAILKDECSELLTTFFSKLRK